MHAEDVIGIIEAELNRIRDKGYVPTIICLRPDAFAEVVMKRYSPGQQAGYYHSGKEIPIFEGSDQQKGLAVIEYGPPLSRD